MDQESGRSGEYDWTPDSRNWSTECECGAEKHRSREACARCTFLDGAIDKQALIIDALRVGLEMSVNDLCKEIYDNTDHSTVNGVRRSLDSMISAGRVARYRVDTYVDKPKFGVAPPPTWLYYLKEKK